jgi:hypothetical protein
MDTTRLSVARHHYDKALKNRKVVISSTAYVHEKCRKTCVSDTKLNFGKWVIRSYEVKDKIFVKIFCKTGVFSIYGTGQMSVTRGNIGCQIFKQNLFKLRNKKIENLF